MRVEEFDYQLPPELIAQVPAERRDLSRLMVLHPDGKVEHRIFHDIVEYLSPRDALVINDTRVIKARLIGRRKDTHGRVEVLLLSEIQPAVWEALVSPGRRVKIGSEISFGEGELIGHVIAKTESGGRQIRFSLGSDSEKAKIHEVLEKLGSVPLPPYIKRPLEDGERYQTVYARHEGSVAAPTAGLHFTPELLERIRKMGCRVIPITLHIGIGTFRPVKVEMVEEHKMHEEHYFVSSEAADAINAVKSAGGRIFAVGTTCVRVLETCAKKNGRIEPGTGATRLFIYPGYQFKMVDAIITNFHLPRSTLLMLVSAFAGREKILKAYEIAIEERYRFYSFGDAMLILS